MQRSISEISSDFNKTVSALINRIERKTRNEQTLADLDRCKSRISLLKSTMGAQALVAESHAFFVKYAANILEPDAATRDKFFLTLDVRMEAQKNGVPIKAEDEFIIGLVDSIRELYQTVSQKEKDEVYQQVKTLLGCSAEYMKLCMNK